MGTSSIRTPSGRDTSHSPERLSGQTTVTSKPELWKYSGCPCRNPMAMDEFTASTRRGRFEFVFMFALRLAILPGELRNTCRRRFSLRMSRDLRVNLLIAFHDCWQRKMPLHSAPGRDSEAPPY